MIEVFVTNNQVINPWTTDELNTLFEVYPSLFDEETSLFFPNRTLKAVREKAKVLKIKKVGRKIYSLKEYNNDYDGGYISGFIDGEGSFVVSVKETENKYGRHLICNPKLTINMRRDDIVILEHIKNYFGCGHVNLRNKTGKSKPQASFNVSSLYDITSKVLPHFEKYPLKAKKKRDYETWKEMVYLQLFHYKKPYNEEYLKQMLFLNDKLRNGRKYVSMTETFLETDEK